MSHPRVIVVAELHGLVWRFAELEALLGALAAGSRDEPGCRAFRVLADNAPGELVLLAEYADGAALRAHYATAHYRRYRQQVGPLLARPSDVLVHHVNKTVQAHDPNPPDPGMFG
jgi:(4S)-4-hydroxy-5-phosphonooxypentane-2,3-dione isomerase